MTNRMTSKRAPSPSLRGRGSRLPHGLLDWNADTSEDEAGPQQDREIRMSEPGPQSHRAVALAPEGAVRIIT